MIAKYQNIINNIPKKDNNNYAVKKHFIFALETVHSSH